jgi:hypothetical protein
LRFPAFLFGGHGGMRAKISSILASCALAFLVIGPIERGSMDGRSAEPMAFAQKSQDQTNGVIDDQGDDSSAADDSIATRGGAPQTLTNFEAANVVIGKKNFTTGGCIGFPSGKNMCEPYGEAVAGKTLYIDDANTSRILGYKSVPTKSGAAAKFVLGQRKLNTAGRGTSQTELSYPTAVVVAGSQLFVNDFSNSRVLIWNKLPTKDDTPPSVVVGQPNFDSNAQLSPPTQASLTLPEAGLAVAGGKLFVSDKENHRVMIWNTIPTTNGADADVVVGQPDFTSSSNGSGPSAFNEPEGIWSDGTRLVVADLLNSRVLIWNSIPTTNGTPADLVVGQEDLSSGGSPNPPTAQSLKQPYAVTSDGSRLFVADTSNNRILVYSPFPTANDAAASFVLGQADFTHGEQNAGNADPSAQTLSNPYGLFINGSQLLVSDYNNARVLIFGI